MSVATLDQAGFGIPVEIERIDRDLNKLWEDAGEKKTRASLINLVLYSENLESAFENTSLIADIAGEHACRAILILAKPDAPEARASAWINAHCRMIGEREICSEQITFVLEGDAAREPAGIVFPHLDSDLPLCLWWQAPLRKPVDARFWAWVDRLIYDSAEWGDTPAGSFAVAREICGLRDGRTVPGDLNWMRVLGTRFALASLFDHALALERIRSLDHVEITHGPRGRMTALLLLGWLAARLDWTLQPMMASPFFSAPDGRQITFALQETDGAHISGCRFVSADREFLLDRQPGTTLYEATVSCPSVQEHPRVVHVGSEKTADLLISELSRGGRHTQYLASLQKIAPLI